MDAPQALEVRQAEQEAARRAEEEAATAAASQATQRAEKAQVGGAATAKKDSIQERQFKDRLQRHTIRAETVTSFFQNHM
jgi:hypothetical protein